MRNLTTYNLNTTGGTFFNETTCGRDAFFRGPHHKVVAFSFYGDSKSSEHLNRGFFEGNLFSCYFDQRNSYRKICTMWKPTFSGIRENVKLVDKFYNKSWVMRLYYDIDQEDDLMDTLCEIACEYDTLDLCFVR